MLQQAGTANAESYFLGLDQKFVFGSPSKTMIQRGIWASQGLALGIKAGTPAAFLAAFQSGMKVTEGYSLGITAGTAQIALASVNAITSANKVMSATAFALGISSGVRYMNGLLEGMKAKFGTPDEKGSIAYYLHVTIPDLIQQYKGPVAYDATILVPAGEAIMGGLDRGLKSGFGGVLTFLKDVGPSMEEHVPDSLFADRTKKFMVDVAMGNAEDPYEYYKDLIPETLGGWSGFVDPALSFLHPTLSLKDTEIMARKLASFYGLTAGSMYRSPAENAAVGGSPTSQHLTGQAADIYGSASNMNKAASDLYAKAAAVFKQIIFNDRDYISGSYVADHMDHVHLGFKPGDGFDLFSGKIGAPPFIDFPGSSDVVDQAIAAAAKKTGLPDTLIAAVMKQESGFNPFAGSYAGAQGLMQLMPDTARSLGVSNVYDPFQNAAGGAKYLKQQLAAFGGNLTLALAAYNAGPGNVQAYGGVPPFSETQHYVKIVQQYFEEFKKRYGGARELGGPVRAGQTYLVGERGPELFTPRASGTIINNQQTTQMMGAQREVVYNDNRAYVVRTNATDARAVMDTIEAHSRTRIGAVNLR